MRNARHFAPISVSFFLNCSGRWGVPVSHHTHAPSPPRHTPITPAAVTVCVFHVPRYSICLPSSLKPHPNPCINPVSPLSYSHIHHFHPTHHPFLYLPDLTPERMDTPTPTPQPVRLALARRVRQRCTSPSQPAKPPSGVVFTAFRHVPPPHATLTPPPTHPRAFQIDDSQFSEDALYQKYAPPPPPPPSRPHTKLQLKQRRWVWLCSLVVVARRSRRPIIIAIPTGHMSPTACRMLPAARPCPCRRHSRWVSRLSQAH